MKKLLAGQPFTIYQTLSGTTSPKEHLAACSQKPPDGVLPGITWKEGDPQDLLAHLQYPCNICLYWPGGTYQLKDGTTQSFEGFGPGFFPPTAASQASRPENKRWACNMKEKIGCYDVCSAAPDGKLTVIETAIELQDRLVGRAGCNAAIIN